MNKLSKMAIIAVSGLLFLTGCSEANRVSENLSQESDNFIVVRKVTVIDAITNDVMFQMSGNGLRFYNNIYTQSRAHTRRELEEAGFEWVFDCPGVEVMEVTDGNN